MELNELQKLVAWLEASDLTSLELERPGEQVRLTLSPCGGHAMISTAEEMADASVLSVHAGDVNAETTVFAETAGIFVATHPMRDIPFAKVGNIVQKNDVLGLLKVNHIYVPIAAPVGGVISRILAKNGDMLGFGEPVFNIARTAGDVEA